MSSNTLLILHELYNILRNISLLCLIVWAFGFGFIDSKVTSKFYDSHPRFTKVFMALVIFGFILVATAAVQLVLR